MVLPEFEQLFAAYGVFVNQLKGLPLFLLAVSTIATGLLFLHTAKIPTITDATYNKILIAALVYLIAVAVYIVNNREIYYTVPNPPPAPTRYPNLRRFFKSVFQVSSLAFFFWCDEPLKATNNIYVAYTCIASFLHILVVLLILRRREDYGFSDGCLAAAFGVVFPMAEPFWPKIGVILVTIILCGLRNLQVTFTQNQATLPQSVKPPSKPAGSRENPKKLNRRNHRSF